VSESDLPAATVDTAKLHLAEAVKRLYLIFGQGLPAMPLVTGAIVWGLWSSADHLTLSLWFAAWLATTPLWLGILIHQYRLHPDRSEDCVRWGRRLTFLTTTEGALCGLAGVLFLAPSAPLQQVLLMTFLIGKVAGSIFAAAWWPPAFYGNALASLLPTAIALFLLGSTEETAIGVGALAFLAAMVFIMRAAHASAMETIALRFEKQELVEQLHHEKEVAEQANLAKSKFLAAASHDLRQPLHAMSLFVSAMEDRARYPETIEIVGNVQRCTTALDSLLQSLLDISKIDAGVITPKPENFRMVPLVGRLIAEFTHQAQAAGLTLTMDCGNPTVHSDPALVERILRNLISNAIRYTPAGRVDIRCYATADRVIVEVSDTGIGIPSDQQECVFDEFVQLGNPKRDRTKGLGLGLAIVRRLAELLDAAVTLSSTPGKGSTFRVTLAGGDPQRIAEPATAEASINSLQGVVVAVIDDEADVREGMRTLLESWGCSVRTGEDATAVIARCDSAGVVPEVVLADYRLRGNITGIDAIAALRDHFQTDIPAAIITGDTAPERLIEAQASGHLLLHKPLRPAKLRVLLQNLRRGVATSV
jgi:two-component system, sensor histidine kinase